MRTRASLPLVLAAVCAVVAPAFADAPIPDTPAGHVLAEWLYAFNSGDRARIEAYHKKWEPKGIVDDTLGFRRNTGGLDLVAVDHSEPLVVSFRAHEKGGPRLLIGRIALKSAAGPVAAFDMGPIPGGMTTADMEVKIDRARRARLLDALAAELLRSYIDLDVAKKMIASLRAHARRGEYDAIDDGYQLAPLLTEHLRAVSHDGHLHVDCVPDVLPPDAPPDDLARATPIGDRRPWLEHTACGFEKFERLEGNVGYLRLAYFGPPAVCAEMATAALTLAGHVEALIIDLRDNGGGDPRGVAWVLSYLFDASTHLIDLYQRNLDKTVEYWSDAHVPGVKFGGKKPLYLLTSHRTYSGAEELAYVLKTLKRATIVGETTGGGAHPKMMRRLDEHFKLGTPYARAISPVTKTDWEGTGVAPDVNVQAERALDVAKKLAADAIRKKAGPPPGGP